MQLIRNVTRIQESTKTKTVNQRQCVANQWIVFILTIDCGDK